MESASSLFQLSCDQPSTGNDPVAGTHSSGQKKRKKKERERDRKTIGMIQGIDSSARFLKWEVGEHCFRQCIGKGIERQLPLDQH